ncbi:MAG: glycoside hydrolase family 127 protein [Dysgonamonadaceae bacterium]|jgi:DUF1680 family protein|nr:glycoside hydrolase family 127 protein [Dysgonamonadaceae bacterium]
MKKIRVSFYILLFFSTFLHGSEIDNLQLVASGRNLAWKSFSLSEVQLMDSYFKDAMDRHKTYVLSLEIDRLIPHVLQSAGLQPKGKNYGGWEAHQKGCTYGHYMSSCAMYYAATGETIFLERLDYIINELKRCQKQHQNGWFLGGEAGFSTILYGKIQLDGPDETGQPWDFNQNGNTWYGIHKALAGLRDAYVYAGRQEALEILRPLCNFITELALNSNHDVFQAMLSVEQGGMNEILADVYSLTGEKKYLEASQRFNHVNVIYPVADGKDVLFGRHANDQIPKFIGVARQYQLTNKEIYLTAAEKFWNMVLDDHTLCIGGNSCYERFGIPGEESKRLDFSSAETCNTYNMLKLSKQLFLLTGDSKYLNYYEHALYNHILASQDPDSFGGVTYYTSLLPGLFKQYSTPYNSFWCCVGTGLENHAKYGEAIYFANDKSVLINLFIPSELKWKEKGLNIAMSTRFPESDEIIININRKGSFTGNLLIRMPEWVKTSPKIKINGIKQKLQRINGFIVIPAIHNHDIILISYPRSLYVEYVKDEPHFGTVMYGPLVLAGDLGIDNMPEDHVSDNRALRKELPLKNIPVLVGNTEKHDKWIIQDQSTPLLFHVKNSARQPDIDMIPYFQMHHKRNSVYWKIYSPEMYALRSQKLSDEIIISNIKNETQHQLKGQNDSIRWHDYFWACNTQFRDAVNGGWFSYELKINKDEKNPYNLICRFWGDESPQHQFDILIEGNVLKTINLNRRLHLTYVDDIYAIPYEWTKGKDKVTVEFRAKENNIAGGLYSLKITSDITLR